MLEARPVRAAKTRAQEAIVSWYLTHLIIELNKLHYFSTANNITEIEETHEIESEAEKPEAKNYQEIIGQRIGIEDGQSKYKIGSKKGTNKKIAVRFFPSLGVALDNNNRPLVFSIFQVLQDISNNATVITKTKSKVTHSGWLHSDSRLKLFLSFLQNHFKKNNESSQLTGKIQKPIKTIEATPLKSIALEKFKESFMTSSSSSLVSRSFVPADKSTPLLNHTNGTTTNQCSALFFTTDESGSCIASETSDAATEPSKSKPKPYSFGMIETDDSTDEEDDVEQRPDKRPPPPAWSLPANRNETILRQSNIPTNIIDKMFGPAMDVDLQEIFPNISKKLLTRRDSSFVWHTPPRYSVMPKY